MIQNQWYRHAQENEEAEDAETGRNQQKDDAHAKEGAEDAAPGMNNHKDVLWNCRQGCNCCARTWRGSSLRENLEEQYLAEDGRGNQKQKSL